MAGDWQSKYLALAEQKDTEAAHCRETEKQLTRLVTRLCVACSGLDPFLDPHLKRLRDAANSESSGKLQREANAFADALIKAGDSRSDPGLINKLLAKRDFSARHSARVATLWSTLAAAPANASDRDLDQLAELLFGSRKREVAPAGKGGLFGRLLGRDGAASETPNRLLRHLLQSIDWPDTLAAQVDEFVSQLENDSTADAWLGVVRELNAITLQSLQRAQRDARSAEEFLGQLGQRLVTIDQHLLSDADARESSRLSGEKLGRSVSNEVGGISASVALSSDVSELKQHVLESLEKIQSHVIDHLRDEAQRRRDAELKSDQLRKQLTQLEHDAFDLRRQVAQSYQQAFTDPLTGLPNRRAYDQRMAQEYARWKRFHEPLAIIVWDIDNFKSINDTFGHKAGDKALALIGNALKSTLRETDFIARYGGEEFVVLLTGAERDHAREVAEKMRVKVESAGLHSRHKPVVTTVSGGLTMFEDGDTVQRVFERADEAMYTAKKQGKNRFISV